MLSQHFGGMARRRKAAVEQEKAMERRPSVISASYSITSLLSPWRMVARRRAGGAHERYTVKPVAEMKIRQLPRGPLYWRVRELRHISEQAKAAAALPLNSDTVSVRRITPR
jgi:hypothetical protein